MSDRIKARREILGLSQSELSRLLEISRQTYYSWESGRCFPEKDKILHLSKSLGTSVSFLYGETEDPRPAPDWHKATGPSTDDQALAIEAASILRKISTLLENLENGEKK